MTLEDLQTWPRPLLIDGATGTELARRGCDTTLPLWSARALLDDAGTAVLRSIHSDYAAAGAGILVTNTFRTTRRALDRAGVGDRWTELNARAVQAARDGAADAARSACLVAGGLAPLEDCYRPDLVPSREACREEHGRQADLLVSLGVDLLILETMNCRREAVAAAEAARRAGADILVSLCPALPDHLLSGEPLAEVVPAIVEAAGPRLRGLLLNCATPEILERVFPLFAAIRTGLPHGLYAHLGEPDDRTGWRLPERHEPDRYAAWIGQRLDEGARIVGGCCGTGPDHIAALARLIAGRAPARPA
jgi:S-methylmethionine-dependent homocysteine/selenocysteine methylase